jgi:hypothetical protein
MTEQKRYDELRQLSLVVNTRKPNDTRHEFIFELYIEDNKAVMVDPAAGYKRVLDVKGINEYGMKELDYLLRKTARAYLAQKRLANTLQQTNVEFREHLAPPPPEKKEEDARPARAPKWRMAKRGPEAAPASPEKALTKGKPMPAWRSKKHQ